MSRLLFAADLALDDPFVGLADVTIDVARVLRDAAAGALDELLRLATTNRVEVVVLVGELARAGGTELAGLHRLGDTLRAWHRSTGGTAVCVPVSEDATARWPDDDPDGGIVVLRPDTSWTVPGADGLVLRRRAGSDAIEIVQHGPSTVVVTVRRGTTTSAGPAGPDGSRTVTLAPAQARVALPIGNRGGVALVDLQAAGDLGTSLPAAVRVLDVERVRLLDCIVAVPSGATDRSDPGNADPGNADPGNADPGNADPGSSDPGNSVPVRSVPAVAAALADEAAAVAAALPRRWVVARARVDGDVATRQLLAGEVGRRDALYAARVATAERGVPLWWERIESVPRADRSPVPGATVVPLTAEVDRLAHAVLEQSGAVVAAAAGALDASLPFDLTVVDPATVDAARDLVLDLLGVEVTPS